MLLFNYPAIYLLARGDSSLIVKYLQAMTKNRYPNLKGLNFLINPNILFDVRYTDREKAEFVGLCSFRRLSDYKLKKETKLHISRVPPWVTKTVVESNPLLIINQPYLEFRTEEKL